MILLSNVTYASEADDLEKYLSDTDISEIYAHNLAMTNIWLNPGDYVAIFDDSQNDTYIKNLSNQIVGSAKTDHDKLVAIYDWVIDNIYYDLDSYNFSVKGATIITDQDREKFAAAGFADVHGWYLVTGPVNTAVLHRGVCWDYSALLYYLLGAQKIPCVIVHGYADGLGGWGEHAWNSVFIDGQWIYLDATWDSNNRYIQEEYYKSAPSHNYLDISLQDLSRNHYPVGLKSSPTNRLGLLCPFCPFTNVLPLFVIWGLTHICRFAHFSTPLVFRRITFQPIIQDKGR